MKYKSKTDLLVLKDGVDPKKRAKAKIQQIIVKTEKPLRK